VLYGHSRQDFECDRRTESFRRFDLTTTRRARVRWTPPPILLSLAWDGGDLYWLRQHDESDECEVPEARCTPELVRTRGVAFRPAGRGEARPHVPFPRR
jgi:hypothetical protein